MCITDIDLLFDVIQIKNTKQVFILILFFLVDLDAAINGMMSKEEDYNGAVKFRCTVCQKIMGARHHMRNHIETHMSITHQCEVAGCQKSFKTRNSRAVHYSTIHKSDIDNEHAFQ